MSLAATSLAATRTVTPGRGTPGIAIPNAVAPSPIAPKAVTNGRSPSRAFDTRMVRPVFVFKFEGVPALDPSNIRNPRNHPQIALDHIFIHEENK
jgi:hypothetical protein